MIIIPFKSLLLTTNDLRLFLLQSVTVQILRSTPEIAMLELESVNALKHTEELMIVQNVLKGKIYLVHKLLTAS